MPAQLRTKGFGKNELTFILPEDRHTVPQGGRRLVVILGLVHHLPSVPLPCGGVRAVLVVHLD